MAALFLFRLSWDEEVAKSAVPADYVPSIFFTCYWRK